MSADKGSSHWLWLRLSSVILVPLTLWVLWTVIRVAGADYADAIDFIGHPFNAGMALLTTAVVAHHAQSGIQVICEDYVAQPLQSLLIWLTRMACLAGLVLVGWATWTIAGSAGV
jgi:succinate dehydrogenase / fumarate reductase, membrane anchor subunit